MYRSFTERVFGGVCGGIAARLPISAWAVRILFVIFTVATLGAFAVLYLMLWLAIPQESLAQRMTGGGVALLVFLLLTAAIIGAWLAQRNGLTQTPTGIDLYLPLLGLLLSAVFFFRQWGRSA